MKTLATAAITITAISIASEFASGKDHGNAAPSFSGTGTSHHAGAPGAVPHFNGAPRFYSAGGLRNGPYRPVIAISNGSRTFVYPSVRATAFHQPTQSGVNRLNGMNSARHVNVHANPGSQHTAMVSGTKVSGGKSSPANRHGQSRLDPQTSAQLRHWQGKTDSFAQARLKHDEHCHHHHDHDWWRHQCRAFIFFDWGWWGWDDGWWYPAWGYEPYDSYYEYNEPIYGYGGLSPEQIVANVQGALQEQGYYTYAVDGVMGPLTQAAIGRYQHDHRLPITYGIDPATLGSLGVIAQ